MFKRLWKRFKQWRYDRTYPDIDDPYFLREYSISVINSNRLLRQFQDNINTPFNELLDWSYNLVMMYSYLVHIHKKTHPIISKEISERFEQGYRDMKLCMANFDHLVAKTFRDKFDEQVGMPMRKRSTVKNVIQNCFDEVSYAEIAYREWAKDSFERISSFRKVIGEIHAEHGKDYPVIDDMVKYAFSGYLMDRMDLLYQKKQEHA